MDRRRFLSTLVGGAALALRPRGLRAAEPARPDLLLVTADDLGRESLGCYGCPVPEITPHLDALAAEGLRFAHGHVNVAACQPSRSVWMTGRYPHRNGAMGFEAVRGDVPLLTDVLHAAGYRCGILGKLPHLAPVERFRWDLAIDGPELGMGRNPARYAEAAAAFAKRARADDKPFFLMVNSHDPHRPFSGSEEEKEKWGSTPKDVTPPSRVYKGSEVEVPGFLPDLHAVRRDLSFYYSSVRRCDDTVGAVLASLDALGLRDSMLVTFLSDNGMAFPFAKAGCYLHSTAVPWIVRWPGRVAAGRVDDRHLVSGVDLLPTLLQAAGLSVPSGVDGTSLLPLLRGEDDGVRERVVTVYHETVTGDEYPMRAVNGPRYGYLFNAWAGQTGFHSDTASTRTMKAIRFKAKKDPEIRERLNFHRQRTREELYDYVSDPDARSNLAADPAQRERLRERRAELRAWMVGTGDPLLAAFDAYLASVAVKDAPAQDAEKPGGG